MNFLAVVILKSENPQQLVKFYRDRLGFPLEARRGAHSCMMGATFFAIHGLQEGQKPTRHLEIGFHFDDLDAYVKTLEKKKVQLADPIREQPWARSATIADPQGNLVYLMQLPEPALNEIRGRLKTL